MKITDIILESHIVSEGQFTKEQLKEIEKLLENATEVNLEQIVEVLEKGGHKVIQKHGHELQVSGYSTQVVNKENQDFVNVVSELVKTFEEELTQQPNTQPVG